MLSLRGARSAGGGAADDVEELEEGEARPDDAGEAFFDFDPDVALAYIDEKLQHVLGHFQKDFEGGVSAENLGSKFGGYGSFLPAYQCSPSLPQTGVPSMVANSRTLRSPYQPSPERMDHNPSTVTLESIPRNNSSGAPSASDICKKERERCSSTNAVKDSVADSQSMDSSFNGSDLKSLIDVGSENGLPRKNAAIYSGLGLDISSSSSMEESPGGLGGLSPEFSNVPYESPRTILQIMTCFPVPGGFFLSPLRGNILHLTNEAAPLLKKWETHLDIENLPKASGGCSRSSLPPVDVRGYVAEKTNSGSKKKKPTTTKTGKDKDDTCAVLNKEINIEMPACQEMVSGMPVPTMEPKDESPVAQESTRNKCISRPSQQYGGVRLKEQTDDNDLATVKAEAIYVEATNYTENNDLGNSGTGYLAPKRKPKSKTSKVEMDLEERDSSNYRYSPFHRKKENNVKPVRKYEVALVGFEGNDDKSKDCYVGPCDDSRNFPVKETFAVDRNEYDDSRIEVKRMQMEHKMNAAAAAAESCVLLEGDNCNHSSTAVIDKRTDSQLKPNCYENKVKSSKDLGEGLPNRSEGDMEGLMQNTSAQGELRKKENAWNTNTENHRFPVLEEQLHMPSTSRVTTTNATPLPVPVVKEDFWVCCDICQKWRLLPYGMNRPMLPKKWKCSMLYWLPGMNRCDISEDEITDALNALNVIPSPAMGVSPDGPHTPGAGTTTSSTYNISGQLEQSRKRKNALSDESGLLDSSYHPPASVPLMSIQLEPGKIKRSADAEHCNLGGDPVSRDGLRLVSNSASIVLEKQVSKDKNRSCYSEEGDLMERTKSLSKLENKRGIDQDGHKTSKKTKREDQPRFDRDWKHECDLVGGEVPDEAKALPSKEKAMKGPGKPGIMSFGRKEKSQPRLDDQDIQKPVAQAVHLPTMDGKQEVFPTSVKIDVSKMKTRLRRSSVENGVQYDTMRQANSNPSDANPIRKDSNMVAFALKEARDLKHKANHLKNKGLELESTGLYFEAALKFLHVASLLETPSFESSRPSDAAQSMKLYSETAKLCKFCAHEYERCKKVAAAALAYKCVEVAYLKAAYYKHPSASKDRQELQAVVQIAPGESSPSSASDNDNINSLGLSKSQSTKDGISPQVAGNHLPLAVRNQAHLLRLLAYINDVNCAFDATHKSQVAITSAAGSLEREKGVDDGLASVKTVLDFHFNNVNELLRLVRLSMESISS